MKPPVARSITRALILTALLAAGPLIAAPSPDETAHVVVSGETLNGIANRAGVSADAVIKANDLKAPYIVRIGQKLTIPRASKPATKPPAAPARSATAKTASVKSATTKAEAAPAASPPAAPSQADTAELARIKAEQAAADKATIARTAAAAAPVAKQVAKTAKEVIEGRNALPDAPVGAGPLAETEHRVVAGETLGSIALQTKVPRVLIAEANGLKPPYAVRLGQTLKIPRTRRHLVRSGDTGFSVALDYAVPWEQIALANNLDAAAPLRVGQNLLIPTLLDPPSATTSPAAAAKPPATPSAPRAARFAWPLTGPMRRGFASTAGDYHDGIDITAPKGTMVRAAAAGTVVFAGKEKDQFGNLVVVDHGKGWHTAYAFLSRVTVKEGASVAAGERVGLVGDTGLAKGDELHFEVRHDGKPVDPLGELPKAS